MAQLVCLRSMWQTLTAAASSLALFAAANCNWGMPTYIGDQDNIIEQIFLAFATGPLAALGASISNAIQVWTVKSGLAAAAGAGAHQARLDHRSIAIITLCPIFIQIPAALANSHDMPEWLQNCDRVTESREKFWDYMCPLELQPARPREAGRTAGVTIDTSEVGHDASAEDSTQWVFLQLPRHPYIDLAETYGATNELECRAALLSMSLAPKPKELSFMIRARNTFQTVVTLVQAGGCILSVLQRLLQRIGISPVEAITTFLSIVVALQLLIELYAFGNYQRPLLLRLDAHQFLRFCDHAPRIHFQVQPRQLHRMTMLSLFLIWLLISIPALYYFLHYLHSHFISALSSFLFFLSQTLLTISFILVEVPFVICFARDYLLLCSIFLFPGSVIVAVVGTMVEWKAFHNPSIPNNWFAWNILPHVSST